MSTETKIRVYKGLATEIACQPHRLKAVAAYLVLKREFKSSVILDFAASRKHLSSTLFVSEKTLYTRLSQMLSIGLATKYKKRVTLVSFERFKELFDITTSNTHFIKDAPIKLEYIIRALAIKENFAKQEYKIKSNHKREGCGLTLEDYVSAEKQRYINAFVNNTPVKEKFNPFVTVGQFKLTELLRNRRKPDRKATNTGGHYWTSRLGALKLLTSEQRVIEAQENTRSTPLGFVFWNGKKKVCKMRNELTFSF